MKIAIVGGGISGASVLMSIIDHPNFNQNIEIDIFEPREILGLGLPYSPDDESVMLNVSPDLLSMDKDNPNDFVEWLDKNFKDPKNFEDLISRPKYGQYLKNKFTPYFNHPQVSHIKSELVDIEIFNQENQDKNEFLKYFYRLKTRESFEGHTYDAVFLAVGHPKYADYYNLSGEKNYLSNPYPVIEKLNALSVDDKIGIIGSGATGVDLMRFIIKNYQLKKPLTFYVRDKAFNFADIPYQKSGFKFSFSLDWIHDQQIENGGHLPLELIVSTFYNDIKAEGVDLCEVYKKYQAKDLKTIEKAVVSKDQNLALIHAYNSKLVSLLPHLYNSLNDKDKKLYHDQYYDKLLFFKARVPYKTFKWIFDLLENNKLKIVSGLSEIKVLSSGKFMVIADTNEEVDFLINATGFETRLKKNAQVSPLINNLYNKKIIEAHLDGRYVLIDWPNAQVVSPKYGLMNNLFFFGLLIGGVQHENNDAQLTHKIAYRAGSYFMQQI